ncbi:MAG: Holliday junction resolvase RuvX [Gammaproteobacteria bacterium]|nr:Holliday junction resolvase RuvX [Gammaproteobacteria bacterium]NIR83372.1 Holliday junction resolvase RuvX [Gammaproteobacteria bacterium]NIR91172.1 Holliday junction resolvase RuvX [Gammaproteobacteria bacterium]NIU04539.1 Holliday junction resolvase RuvX [Gammaproteobacteria bacterium]NIW87175.1 Holliday junction resolvase RuvX [Gammaproteobacteria bacterium]
MTRPRTLLGFDYGHKRIGVAVGQTLTATATPLTTVRVTAAEPDWESIGELIETWQPDALVVGIPLNMDGTEQATTRAAREFGRELARRFRLPIYGADERLSTIEARRRMVEAGRHALDEDPVAAQIILEAWLQGRRAEP